MLSQDQKQELFDKAVSGVLKQGGFSKDSGRCVYLAHGGFRCGIGHCVPMEVLVKSAANNTDSIGAIIGSINPIATYFEETYGITSDQTNDVAFLTSLQSVHDGYQDLPTFQWAAKHFAELYKLNFDVITNHESGS
jgi:hypothetical protein